MSKTPRPLTDVDGSIRWDYWIGYALWEEGEYILTFGGCPVGQTLARQDARRMKDWLGAAFSSIPLVSAAPEMLKALKHIEEWLETEPLFEMSEEGRETMAVIRSAINVAEGVS